MGLETGRQAGGGKIYPSTSRFASGLAASTSLMLPVHTAMVDSSKATVSCTGGSHSEAEYAPFLTLGGLFHSAVFVTRFLLLGEYGKHLVRMGLHWS